MAAKQLIPEDKFIKTNNIAELYNRAKTVDANLWSTLQGIAVHYDEYSRYCEAIVKNEVLEILNKGETKGIHSARFRVKKRDSLIRILIRYREQWRQVHEWL